MNRQNDNEMADLRLNIVSPEKLFFDGEAESVTLPGVQGAFTILPQHAPIVSSLGEGVVKYVADGELHEIPAKSGFVEMSDGNVTVCVEE